jgi:hypothetical protein
MVMAKKDFLKFVELEVSEYTKFGFYLDSYTDEYGNYKSHKTDWMIVLDKDGKVILPLNMRQANTKTKEIEMEEYKSLNEGKVPLEWKLDSRKIKKEK